MKPWPERDWYVNYSNDDWSGYERARADAAIERLVAAVQALKDAGQALDDVGAHVPCEKAAQALAAIGPIPTDGKEMK
jgi:hypothetical protein